MNTGACLIGNELTDQATQMIQARVQGKSWADIAQEHGLNTPQQARNLFTKLTGITDYKIKGQALKKMVADGIDPALTAKKVKAVKKTADDLLGVKSMKVQPGNTWIDSTLSKEGQDAILDLYNQGHGYLSIKTNTGATFEEIDQIVWNDLVKKHDGDLWKAYKEKPTSETGYKTLKDSVNDLRAKGMSIDDIFQLVGSPPKDVLEAILEGRLKLPPPGSKAINIIPKKAPTPSPSSFSVQQKAVDIEVPPAVSNHPPIRLNNEEFPLLSNSEMREMYPAHNLTTTQKRAIQNYTGSGYMEINGASRGLGTQWMSPTEIKRLEAKAKAIDRSLVPSPRSFGVNRNVDQRAFERMVGPDLDLEKLKGQVISDKGFLSTSVRPGGVFSANNVHIIIEAPKGTLGRYVDHISQNSGEQEFLMARNTRMIVKDVRKTGEKNYDGKPKWIIVMQVLV